jgi:P4 family phage/plasmid primase-like protien
VAEIGKFAERGRHYFERTLAKAENHTREKIYERNHAKHNGKASWNGTAPIMPSGPMPPGPSDNDGGDGEEGEESPDDRCLPEEQTDSHRLAREWLAHRARHEQPGDSAAYYRESIWRWEANRCVAIPDREVAAIINCFIRQIFEQDARLQRLMQEDRGPEESPPTMPTVTRKLAADVIGAIEGLVMVPQSVDQPSWQGPDNPGPRNWISFRNGILDVDALLAGADQVLRPQTPHWFSQACLPYDFDASANCPRWSAFLDRNLGDDPHKQELFQQWAGYLLLPDNSQQHLLVMVGEDANGKSVACEVLTAMLGEDNVSSEPLELFADKFRLVNTLGKLANITADVGELDKVAEGMLKAFVVGDPISFERKFKQAFTTRPTARLMLATNNVPAFSDKSDGIWRRMILLPFNVKIPQKERIVGMDKWEWWRAAGEVPGILNWALSGLADLRNKGRFTIPGSCQEALDRVRQESNPARRFLTENFKAGSGEILKTELYKLYREWCGEHGHHSLAEVGFGKEVHRAFPVVRDGKAYNANTQRRENTYAGLDQCED